MRARSPHDDERGSMKQHARHAANQRAVDTDVLQITPDLRFDFPADFPCEALLILRDDRRVRDAIAATQATESAPDKRCI